MARTTIVPALPAFMATFPIPRLGSWRVVEHGSPSRSGSRGFDLRIASGSHQGRDADCPPARQVASIVNAASPSPILRAKWRPRSLVEISSARNTAQFTLRRRWAQSPLDGNTRTAESYGTLQLPGALHVNSAQTYLKLRCRSLRRTRPDSGPTSGDWPILREWSVPGIELLPDFQQQCRPRRLPGSSGSAQPVAPSPRIHDMDRKCARALPRIANDLQSITQQPNANDIFVTLAAVRWHWLVWQRFFAQ